MTKTTYDIDLTACEDVTEDVQSHFSYQEWSADKPHYTYDNVLIWDGGMGLLLLQDRKTERYYYHG